LPGSANHVSLPQTHRREERTLTAMAANPPTPSTQPASTAIVTAPPGSGQIVTLKQKLNDVRGLLEKMRDQLVMALPKHFTADRFLRITLTAVQKEPKLLDCYRPSF